MRSIRFLTILAIFLFCLSSCGGGGGGEEEAAEEEVTTTSGSPAKFSIVEISPSIITSSSDSNPSTCTINIKVMDKDGNLVSDGNEVSFTNPKNGGTIEPVTTTTQNGLVSVTYTAPKSVPPDGTDSFIAKSGTAQSDPIVITIANLSGAVFDENGNPINEADVYVYSPKYTTQTDSNGNFKLWVPPEEDHILFIEDPNKVNIIYSISKEMLQSGKTFEIPIMLQSSNASLSTISSSTDGLTLTNQFKSYTSTLFIPKQEDGFYVHGKKENNILIKLEILDLKKFLPVPLPGQDYKKVPYFLVAISPYSLTLTKDATLTIPAISGAEGLNLYHFNLEDHDWEDTGIKVSSTKPTFVSINMGGIYGVFYEEKMVGNVKVKSTPGSWIFIGDQIVQIENYEEIITNVPIASDAEPLTVYLFNIDKKTIQENTVAPKKDEIVEMETSKQVEIGNIILKSGASKVAVGTKDTAIIAMVTDSSGNPISGLSVEFSIISGGGQLSNNTATTDSNGNAKVYFDAPTTVGITKIKAQAGGFSSEEIQIEISAGPPAKIDMEALPSQLTASSGTNPNTATISLMVLDQYGNPVTDGEIITFPKPEYGSLDTYNVSTKDGMCTVIYTAPSFVPPEGNVTIEAKTGNGISQNVKITIKGPQISYITLSISPSELPADGESTATVSAHVYVEGGGDAPDGTIVHFQIIEGDGSLNPQDSSTSYGVAETTLTASAKVGSAKIRAECGGKTAEVEIQYKPGSITLIITPNSLLATGEEKATVRVELTDANGDPAPAGEIVKFSLNDPSLGTIPAEAQIVEGGYTEVEFSAYQNGGTATITATWHTSGVDITAQKDIIINPPPFSISLDEGYPDPPSIDIMGTGGNSTSIIQFVVRDSQGYTVVDGYRVDFYLISGPNGGEKLSIPFDVTKGGKVRTIIKSGSKSGPVYLKAVYHNDTNVTTGSVGLNINTGPPVGEGFGISLKYLNISGWWKIGLEDPAKVSLSDIYGNPIPDGTSVSFKTYDMGGMMSPASNTTSGGISNSALISTTDPKPIGGLFTVTAEVQNAGRTTRVTSIAVNPQDPSIMYIGTNGGGVYKSTDYGASWTNVSRSSQYPGQNWLEPYINDIKIEPDDSDTIYVATGHKGKGSIFRSKDGGLNWNTGPKRNLYAILRLNYAILSLLCDDNNSDYVWAGTEGDGIYYSTDGGDTFNKANGIEDGVIIREISKLTNTNGENAILFAATNQGVFKSNDGGKTWDAFGSFLQNNITTIAIHPNGYIYAGTEEAGVWYSPTDNPDWKSLNNGLGRGVIASDAIPSMENKGTGTISDIKVGKDTKTEEWTVECISTSDGGEFTFSVKGTESGKIGEFSFANEYTFTKEDVLSFKIKNGSSDFQKGDKFTFSTIRDKEHNIKDILVDYQNNRLYIATYFWGANQSHAIGNVLFYPLNDDGSPMDDSSWTEANNGLPQFEPPDDTSLYAIHTLSLDSLDNPSYIFAGGEGINLYKSSLDTGNLSWEKSMQNLSNLIFARIPVLFSGDCNLTTQLNNNILYIWVRDSNYNPPIKGSSLVVRAYNIAEEKEEEILNVEYGDEYLYKGTFDDPTHPYGPYIVPLDYSKYKYYEITFTPYCSDPVTAPGCSSGGSVTIKY